MKKFIEVNEVAEILNVSVSCAYKIIRDLNDELKKMGFFTVSGKVNRKFFEKKFMYEGE